MNMAIIYFLVQTGHTILHKKIELNSIKIEGMMAIFVIVHFFLKWIFLFCNLLGAKGLQKGPQGPGGPKVPQGPLGPPQPSAGARRRVAIGHLNLLVKLNLRHHLVGLPIGCSLKKAHEGLYSIGELLHAAS